MQLFPSGETTKYKKLAYHGLNYKWKSFFSRIKTWRRYSRGIYHFVIYTSQLSSEGITMAKIISSFLSHRGSDFLEYTHPQRRKNSRPFSISKYFVNSDVYWIREPRHQGERGVVKRQTFLPNMINIFNKLGKLKHSCILRCYQSSSLSFSPFSHSLSHSRSIFFHSPFTPAPATLLNVTKSLQNEQY